MNGLFEVVGWMGAGLMLTAYALVSSGRLDGRGTPFQLLNLVGSAGLIANTIHHGAWPSATVNVIWAAVAAAALLWRRSPRVSP